MKMHQHLVFFSANLNGMDTETTHKKMVQYMLIYEFHNF